MTENEKREKRIEMIKGSCRELLHWANLMADLAEDENFTPEHRAATLEAPVRLVVGLLGGMQAELSNMLKQEKGE